MITYIIKSQGLYRIGKTENLKYRISCFHTHNPSFELIYTIDFDCELFLQNKFKEKNVKLEWFNLEENDIIWIRENKTLLSNNTFESLSILRKQKEEELLIQKKLIKKEKKRLTLERQILKRNLEDKEAEE